MKLVSSGLERNPRLIEIELVTYPLEDHGPLSGGMMGRPVAEPWHGYDVRQRMMEFIEKAFNAPADGDPKKP